MSLLRCLAVAAASCLVVPLATARAALPPELEDPGCLGVNKEPAHATLMPYANLDEALAARRHASSFARSLNGTWKFHYVPHPDQRPVDFYKTDFDASGWAEIPVPSCWQLLGYGTPYYLNRGYIFQKDWPRVMTDPPKDWTAYKERNPVGSYRRTFEVPEEWKGRRVFITFDGVDSAFYLWVNGQKVGYSVNSRNAAEFDLTKYLRPGSNLLAVEVYRFSAGSYLEDQDMWRLSGIFRNVTLWSAPGVHVRDFFVKTDLDQQYRDATLKLVAKVKNQGAAPAPARLLSLALYDNQRKQVGQDQTVAVPALAPGEERTVEASMPVSNPLKWTAETPNLYTAVVLLSHQPRAGGGGGGPAITETLSGRVGFRKVEIDGRVYKINGVAVKLKGANRHEHWPDTGHYVTEERMVRDIEVLKQCNCNHVRTCHYSDDPRWYELCDEYGLYLCAEANIESHGYGYGPESLSHPPEWKAAHVDRVVANVENFKNHASVVMWSLGNEAGPGPNFHAALAAGRAIDTSRPYHYERFGIGKGNPADIDSEMYTDPAGVERHANDPDLTKPYYMCEYAHAMFNSMGSIGDYNDLFDKYPALMGGAIWEWQDQGVWNRRDPKRPFLAFGGGFGEVPNDQYFIHKGVVFSDRTPKPHYPEAKKAYQWISFDPVDLKTGQLRIRNRYAFTNLKTLRASWTISRDGEVVAQGELPRLDVAPGAETGVKVPTAGPVPSAEDFLRIAFSLPEDQPWAKAGFEVASEQFALPTAAAMGVTTVSNAPLKLTREGDRITVANDRFRVVFDRAAGTMVELGPVGGNVLRPDGGPRLHLWRAPHRNDDMWAYQEWERVGLTDLTRETVLFDGEAVGADTARVEIGVMATGKNGFRVLHSALYTIGGDGAIAVDNAVMPQGRRVPIARLGVRLLLDPALDRFTYLGRGPMENYADRKRGSDVGLYSSTVRENMTNYAKPMECGNHEDVRWAALTSDGRPGLLAQADGTLLQVSALPYTDEVMTPIEYTVDLPPSESTVVTLATRTLGVGSNGCGPRPLEPCVVRTGPSTFSYVLRAVPAGSTVGPLRALGRGLLPRGRVGPVLAQRDAHGHVELTTATQGATIEYSTDGQSWRKYSGPFELEGPPLVRVRARSEQFDLYEGVVVVPAPNPRAGWKIRSSSSQEPGEGLASHVLDGSLDTFWHSRWSDPAARPPHTLVIDFGRSLDVSAVVYEARRDMDHGHVKDYEVYLGPDGQTWGPPAAKGAFHNGDLTQTIRLARPTAARFLKFVALSEQSGGPFATVAELSVVASGE